MSILPYFGTGIGAAGGASNIAGGVQEGDIGQTVGGVRKTLGAYVAASSIVSGRAAEAAYKLAIEQGLDQYAATLAAQESGKNATLAGSQSIGEWLPFIGVGLALWNIAENGLTWGSGAGLAASAAPFALTAMGANPYALTVGLPVALQLSFSAWRDKEKWEKGRKHVYFQNSEVTPVGQDAEGWTYLRLSSGAEPEGFEFGDKVTDTGLSIMLRYNPETNELQQVNGYQPTYTNKEGREAVREHYKLSEEGYGKGVSLSDRAADLTPEEWTKVYTEGGFVFRDEKVQFISKRRGRQYINKSFIYAKDGVFDIPEDWINQADYPDSKSWKEFMARGGLDTNKVHYSHGIDGKGNRKIYRHEYTGGRDEGLLYGWKQTEVPIVNLPDMNSYNWGAFDPSKPISVGHQKRHILLWNTKQLQSSIYNNVLVPQGLAPQITPQTEGWQQVTSGGNTYLTDGINVADMEGKIFATVNNETGAIQDLNITGGWRFDSKFESPRNDKPPPYNVLGTVDNWDSYSFNLPAQGAPGMPGSEAPPPEGLPPEGLSPELPGFVPPGGPLIPNATGGTSANGGLPRFQMPGSTQPSNQPGGPLIPNATGGTSTNGGLPQFQMPSMGATPKIDDTGATPDLTTGEPLIPNAPGDISTNSILPQFKMPNITQPAITTPETAEEVKLADPIDRKTSKKLALQKLSMF